MDVIGKEPEFICELTELHWEEWRKDIDRRRRKDKRIFFFKNLLKKSHWILFAFCEWYIWIKFLKYIYGL
jgi:hypothetical protein